MPMTKTNLVLLAGIMLAVVMVMGGLPLLKGGFYIGKHEGDTLHLAELVLRMANGELPHLDVMTPIGILAMAPMVLFVKFGLGLGHAIFYAQILVALALLPAVLRVAQSRMAGAWPYFYGAFVMVLCLALVHGEAEKSVSISMHYNRWAWAVAYIIIPLAVLSPLTRPQPALDGVIIGIGLGLLALTKVTYFVSFAPAILVPLLARREWGTILAAGLAGLAVAGITTLFTGPEFWLAYLNDLRTVSASVVRPNPGEPLGGTIASPPYMGASITLIAAVIMLRQAGRSVEGMALLFLMPGFFYVTYQNFGNDPQWLFLLVLIIFMALPSKGVTNGLGWDLRDALRITGILAIAFGAPSAINLAYSPFRHFSTSEVDRVPLLPGLPAHHDILTIESRIYQVDVAVSADGPGQPLAAYRDRADRPPFGTYNGEALPECVIENGMHAWFETVSADLTAAGYGGKAILSTDLFNLFWAFGDFAPVKRSAPWYYGGLSGVENADYLVIPLCPVHAKVRAGMLSDMEKGGWTLTEVRRTPLYILAEAKAP